MKTKLPLSKSWTIRMIFLDMLYGKKTDYKVITSLNNSKEKLSDDIKAALNTAETYLSEGDKYDVGDSGTVCRFLIYILGEKDYQLLKGVQLSRRKIDPPDDLNKLSLEELLKLKTTQYASAALLTGIVPIDDLPSKCKLTVEARKVYFENNGEWISREDEVIARQLDNYSKGGRFNPLIAEDYCYSRVFEFITKEEGEKRWPELKNHESDRIKVMEEALSDLKVEVDVHEDHRVAMAVALKQKSLGLPVNINNRECVSKSWPEFWEWLEENVNK